MSNTAAARKGGGNAHGVGKADGANDKHEHQQRPPSTTTITTITIPVTESRQKVVRQNKDCNKINHRREIESEYI